MKIKIIHFKKFPEDEPDGYDMGFDVMLENGRTFYVGSFVYFNELGDGIKTDEEIVQMGFNKEKKNIMKRVEELTTSSIIQGLEIDIDGEYETKLGTMAERIDNLELTMDTLTGYEGEEE